MSKLPCGHQWFQADAWVIGGCSGCANEREETYRLANERVVPGERHMSGSSMHTPIYKDERIPRRHMRKADYTNECGTKSNFATFVPAEVTCERCQRVLSPSTLNLDSFKWEV